MFSFFCYLFFFAFFSPLLLLQKPWTFVRWSVIINYTQHNACLIFPFPTDLADMDHLPTFNPTFDLSSLVTGFLISPALPMILVIMPLVPSDRTPSDTRWIMLKAPSPTPHPLSGSHMQKSSKLYLVPSLTGSRSRLFSLNFSLCLIPVKIHIQPAYGSQQ